MSNALRNALADADRLVRPDGTTEPGYEGALVAVAEDIVRAWRVDDDYDEHLR